MSTKLFIGNLSFKVTDIELRDAFAAFDVVNAEIVRDKYTGNSRGFAFVELANQDNAIEAVRAMNGHDLAKRPLRVEIAKGNGPSGGGNNREHVQRFRD
jgi:RNA recognition motif-containing protein